MSCEIASNRPRAESSKRDAFSSFCSRGLVLECNLFGLRSWRSRTRTRARARAHARTHARTLKRKHAHTLKRKNARYWRGIGE
eukprot:15447033-Alexandrium_andersonii.AAC.1